MAYLVKVILGEDEADDEPQDPQIWQSLIMLLLIVLIMVGGIGLGLVLLF